MYKVYILISYEHDIVLLYAKMMTEQWSGGPLQGGIMHRKLYIQTIARAVRRLFKKPLKLAHPRVSRSRTRRRFPLEAVCERHRNYPKHARSRFAKTELGCLKRVVVEKKIAAIYNLKRTLTRCEQHRELCSFLTN